MTLIGASPAFWPRRSGETFLEAAPCPEPLPEWACARQPRTLWSAITIPQQSEKISAMTAYFLAAMGALFFFILGLLGGDFLIRMSRHNPGGAMGRRPLCNGRAVKIPR